MSATRKPNIGGPRVRDYTAERLAETPERKQARLDRTAARKIVGLPRGDPRHVDHIVPLSKGGTNDPRNLRVVSAAENLAKGSRMPPRRGRR